MSSARPEVPEGSPTPPAEPVSPGYDVVLSIAGEDESLGWALYHALKHPNRDNVYFYRLSLIPRHDPRLLEEWKQACGPGQPFFVVVFSEGYQGSTTCLQESAHLREVLDSEASDGFSRLALVIRGADPDASVLRGPPDKFYLDATDLTEDEAAEAVCEWIVRYRGGPLWTCERSYLLKHWNPAAHERWEPPYPRDAALDDECREANLALAAAVGRVEQLERAAGVVSKLDRLVFDLERYQHLCEHCAPDDPASQPPLNDQLSMVIRALDDLLHLFLPRVPPWHPRDTDREQPALLRRFRNYLLRHLGLNWEVTADRFRLNLQRLSRPPGNRPHDGPRLRSVRNALAQALQVRCALLTRLGLPASRLSGYGEPLHQALRDFSVNWAESLRKRAPYNG